MNYLAYLFVVVIVLVVYAVMLGTHRRTSQKRKQPLSLEALTAVLILLSVQWIFATIALAVFATEAEQRVGLTMTMIGLLIVPNALYVGWSLVHGYMYRDELHFTNKGEGR